jgi:cation diffusion facilitator family transporter
VHQRTLSSAESDARATRAMRLSLAAGILMLAGKGVAWWATGSAAILSDALESVIHNVAVAFAAFSLWLSRRPANARFHYGYERITFFSAGFEGALIAAAGIAIIVTSVYIWLQGIPLEQLNFGVAVTATLAVLNGALGWYLVSTGRRTNNLILVANGKHVLSDCWTSAGVVVGLLLVLATGWRLFDPIFAILAALNIFWEGLRLVWQSIRGLLDYADPVNESRLRAALDSFHQQTGVGWHELRFRETGGRLLVEVHLLFPYDLSLGKAHEIATGLEETIQADFSIPVEVVTHLESHEDHGVVHHAHRAP